MTVAIVYNAGSYGTYLEWCLTSLITSGELISPFTSLGNSHQFNGHQLHGFHGWQQYQADPQKYPFVRLHPKTAQDEQLSNNLDYICNSAQSVIYIYPDPDSVLLCINNYLTKIWSNWWERQFSSSINKDLIYQNWPIAADTELDQIPRWVQREFLSFYLMPAWFDQVEWNHLDCWSHPNACVVTVKDLLFDFEKTLERIQKHCGTKFVRPILDLVPYHDLNLKLQTNLCQDRLCQDIVSHTLSDQDLSWNTLPIGSEAWVQWRFRELGFEIECDKLDTFPTNSVQLKKLLYPV
jgi:hypothetical protein